MLMINTFLFSSFHLTVWFAVFLCFKFLFLMSKHSWALARRQIRNTTRVYPDRINKHGVLCVKMTLTHVLGNRVDGIASSSESWEQKLHFCRFPLLLPPSVGAAVGARHRAICEGNSTRMSMRPFQTHTRVSFHMSSVTVKQKIEKIVSESSHLPKPLVLNCGGRRGRQRRGVTVKHAAWLLRRNPEGKFSVIWVSVFSVPGDLIQNKFGFWIMTRDQRADNDIWGCSMFEGLLERFSVVLSRFRLCYCFVTRIERFRCTLHGERRSILYLENIYLRTTHLLPFMLERIKLS